MTDENTTYSAASGLAALSICESLILTMGDLKVMGEHDAVGVLSDAADANRNVKGSPSQVSLHREAAAILDRIIAGGNSIRRP
jgi:hypothetical protein